MGQAKRRARTTKVKLEGDIQVLFERICALAGYGEETAIWAAIARTAACEVQRGTGGGHFALDVLTAGIPKAHIRNWMVETL